MGKKVVWDVDPTSDSCAVMVSAYFPTKAAAKEAVAELGGSLDGSGFEYDGEYAYCMVGDSWDSCFYDNDMTERETDDYQAETFRDVRREIKSAGHDWREV